MGRQPIPPAVVALVRELRAAGHPARHIPALCAAQGETISRSSVQNITAGRHLAKRPSTSRLKRHETRLATPISCPGCQNTIDVVPCRICGTRRYLAAMRAVVGQRLAEPRKRPARPATRKRHADDPRQLSLALESDALARLEEVKLARRGLFALPAVG